MAVRVDLGEVVGPQGPEGPIGPQGPQGATGATGATGPKGPSCIPLAANESVASPSDSSYWRKILFADGTELAPCDGWMRLELIYKEEFDVHVWVKNPDYDIILMLQAHSYEWGDIIRARLCFPVPKGCFVEVEKTYGTDFSSFRGVGVFNYCNEED